MGGIAPQPPQNHCTLFLLAFLKPLRTTDRRTVLPPAFLLLVVLNCLFLGVIAWVFDHNAETRNALLTKIVERCLVQQREPR
jgi:hypothetical protein